MTETLLAETVLWCFRTAGLNANTLFSTFPLNAHKLCGKPTSSTQLLIIFIRTLLTPAVITHWLYSSPYVVSDNISGNLLSLQTNTGEKIFMLKHRELLKLT